MMKRKITIIFVVFMAFTSFVSNHAFSQGKIHLGSLRIYPLFSERIEVDDNILQVSGTGRGTNPDTGLLIKGKESDLINIYTPGLKLDLPFRGGGLIPGKRHELSLDWHSDFKNYRDHASENQQNHYFTASGILKFNRGFEINLENEYKDTESPAGSETDNIHPVRINTGEIIIDMPDYFRKFDAEFSYSNHQLEYDERALRRANRFEHKFTLKIPYKLTPKIKLFPEYTYGFIEYDSQSVLNPQSDSHYNEFYVGAEWYATAKSTGIFKLGFTEMRFDDTETSDIATFIAEIGVRVYLTKRMELDVNAGRGVLQSEFTARSNSFERSFGDFRISRQVWKDLSASFNANYEKQVYHGSKRKDDVYGFGLSTKYDIKKRMSAEINYTNRDRHSNIETESDRINIASVGISFIF
ncbi:MAG: outer membrane beta-barrel protein [Candidatus Scalindua sediminis]|nr:outer membrane beta-barrel protein [Candidatus Scalindua sediminis]